MSEVVDSTAEEIGTDLATVEAAPPPSLFGTDDPVEVVTRAARVADALKDLLVRQGLTQNIQGKPHVRVEGWQALGAMLNVTAVCVATEEIEGGWKATVEARTPDGRVVGRADALCTKFEKRGPWKNADDYARLSMAQTRATSKALKGPLGFVVSLAGYQTTPAEEMTFAPPDAEESPVIGDVMAQHLNSSIYEATRRELLDGAGLADLFQRAGAHPERIDRSAVAALTVDQASRIDAELTSILGAIS